MNTEHIKTNLSKALQNPEIFLMQIEYFKNSDSTAEEIKEVLISNDKYGENLLHYVGIWLEPENPEILNVVLALLQENANKEEIKDALIPMLYRSAFLSKIETFKAVIDILASIDNPSEMLKILLTEDMYGKTLFGYQNLVDEAILNIFAEKIHWLQRLEYEISIENDFTEAFYEIEISGNLQYNDDDK